MVLHVKKGWFVSFFLLFFILLIGGCQKKDQVVVYTSVDRVYSEQLFDLFEAETGIDVLPVYDVEAAKTTGLVQRLIAEKDHPEADVFWNGEIMYSLKLAQEGVFQAYQSPESSRLPATFVSPYWTAFGGRARVLILNKKQVAKEDIQASFMALKDQADTYRVGLANPIFGTTATHVAALYSEYGQATMTSYMTDLDQSQVHIVEGNGAVRDLVVSGQLDFGITDTDDALGAVNKGAPVDLVFPDQGKDQPGTLVVPNSVGLVKGAQNPEAGKAFIDFLLKEDTLSFLIDLGWFQLSVGDTLLIDDALKPFVPESGGIKVMPITFDDILETMDLSSQEMEALYGD